MAEAGGTRTAPDAIVVGGGAMGLAATNALLARGLRTLSLYPGDGANRPSASRAAGAMLGAFGEITADDGPVEQVEFEFRLAAQRMYPRWLAEIEERAGLSVHQSRGTFVIANAAGVRDREGVKRMEAEARRVGEPAQWVDMEDVPGLKPNTHHVPLRCLHVPNEHSVDADQLLAALSAAAASYEGWSHHDGVALSARPGGAGWVVETEAGETLSAPQLVLCAGSRSLDPLDPELRAEAALPEMYFGKGVSCLVRGAPPVPQTIRTPNRAFACGIHVVPRSGDLLYVGATNCLGVDHAKEVGFQPGELHNLFDEILHQINVDIRESRIEEIRVGYRPIVSHRRPVIGPTRLPGLSIGTGTYRNGMLMAPRAAAIIAEAICGGEQTVENPYGVDSTAESADLETLSDIGIRDIISFLHEPRGSLPYDRAAQLRKYVTTLFQMSVLEDDERLAALRRELRQRLEEAPFNETMHKLFYDIVERADSPAEDKVPAEVA